MNIFLDLGANYGDTVDLFYKGRVFDVVDPTSYYYYCFEPCEECNSSINSYLCRYNIHGEVINKACWIEDSEVAFLKTHEKGYDLYGSTIFVDDKNIRHGIEVEKSMVQTVDFSRWVKKNVKTDDNVLCKMDIEGCEFDVLSKMIDDGTAQLISEIAVEWHNKKFKEPSRSQMHKKYKDITHFFKEKGIPLKSWR